jgi:MFS family permease
MPVSTQAPEGVPASADSSSEGPLLGNRSFHGHVGAQFFGAFNDNLFKQLILFLAARELFPGDDKQGLAFAVFSLPFILFSGVAGDLSERYSKRLIIVLMKVCEIGIMIAGAIALQQRSWTAMLVVLFVMGTHSAFFGPPKYGVIPEIVGKGRLMTANGIITMTTFLSILFGQALAGPLLDRYGQRLWVTGAWCVGFALIGTALALMIRRLPAVRPSTKISRNPFGGVFKSIKELRTDPRVFQVLLLNSLFWFNGGVVQQALVGLGASEYLDIPKQENWRLSVLLVVLAVSIITGSLCVPPISKRIRPGKLVAFGAIAMFVAQGLLALVISLLGARGYGPSVGLVAALGFTGAFFAVPVQTFLQDAPEEGTRGKTFAVNNFLNFIFIFLAGGFYLGSSALHLSPALAATVSAALMCGVLMLHRKSVLSIEQPKNRV